MSPVDSFSTSAESEITTSSADTTFIESDVEGVVSDGTCVDVGGCCDPVKC